MADRLFAQRFARRLHSLGGGTDLVRKAAARELGALNPVDLNELVDHLIGLTQEGWDPASCALSAILSALKIEADQIPHAQSLKRIADLQALEVVSVLFTDAPARKELDPDEASKADARKFVESLGHLKQKARQTRDPDELSKLATASEPTVVRNALLNPRLTEPLVVRIAARRPARPEPLLEIWKSPRWSALHAVRRALAFNPYLPPDVGVKIIPLLQAKDWKEIATDASLHPSLREQAALLLSGAEKRKP